jgi:hypothetical protein
LSDCRFVYRRNSNLEVKIAQVFRNQRLQTHFSPQNSIFVDFFGAETQAGAGITLHEQKAMVNDFELLNYDPHPALK